MVLNRFHKQKPSPKGKGFGRGNAPPILGSFPGLVVFDGAFVDQQLGYAVVVQVDIPVFIGGLVVVVAFDGDTLHMALVIVGNVQTQIVPQIGVFL